MVEVDEATRKRITIEFVKPKFDYQNILSKENYQYVVSRIDYINIIGALACFVAPFLGTLSAETAYHGGSITAGKPKEELRQEIFQKKDSKGLIRHMETPTEFIRVCGLELGDWIYQKTHN